MGHKRTIRPNAKKLSALFMARDIGSTTKVETRGNGDGVKVTMG